MGFWKFSIALHLKRILRQWSISACLLVLPLLVMATGLLLPPGAQPNILKVGILLPEKSERGELIWDRLLQYSDAQTLFIRAESEEQVRAMVAGRNWECGYMFVEDLDVKLGRNDYDRIITRVMSPASMTLFTGWTLSPVVLEVCVPDIAVDYLKGQSWFPSGETGALPPYMRGMYGGDEISELKIEEIDKGYEDAGAADPTGASLSRGFIALFLFVVSYLCVVQFHEDMDSDFFGRLAPYVSRPDLLSSFLGAVALPMLTAGTLSVLFGKQFFPIHFTDLMLEVMLLVLYLFCLAGFSFLLSLVLRNRNAMIAALPFFVILCLLLSPILFDIGQWVGEARLLADLLPPAHYMKVTSRDTAFGDYTALWRMIWYTLAIFGLVAGIHYIRRRAVTSRRRE